MRSSRRPLLATLIAATLLVVGIGAPAQADLASCNMGNACMWTNDSYGPGGFFQQVPNSVRALAPLTFHDSINSVASYGNAQCTRWYENVDYTGKSIRFSRPALGGTYRDPHLANGGGTGAWAGENWENRIDSILWVNC